MQDSNEGNESKGYAYDKTTFSSRREMLDFIKSLDFDKNPPLKRLHDFYNNEQKITEDKILRKGVDLFMDGKVKKSLKYFYKISKNYNKYTKEQRDYARWQIMHYRHFGDIDIYFNGIPSHRDRINIHPNYNFNPKIKYWYDDDIYFNGTPSGRDRINTQPNYNCYPEIDYWGDEYSALFIISDPQLSSYDPSELLRIITATRKYAIYKDELLSNKSFTKEFVAAVLYEAFPKDGKLGIDKLGDHHYDFGYKPLKGDEDCDDIKLFFNYLDCLHIIARTDWGNKSYYGIGLSANELYKKAKALNPNKKFNLLDYQEGIKNMTENDEQCQILLLRSAYYGNPDAMLELQPYIIESVQFRYRDFFVGEGKYYKKGDKIGRDLYRNIDALESICRIYGIERYSYNKPDGLTKIGAMKDYPYIWEIMGKSACEALSYLKDLRSEHEYAQRIEEKAKRERRKQFWGNLAGAVVQGLAIGVNTYMAVNNYGSAPMNTAAATQVGHAGSLADAMSQPGFFQREQQRLLQQSMNQVQWAEMQEYNQTREAYQRMGRDLSIDEFRALKGQAIINLKEQGIDIIAEQNAANREMHEFNRSQMNSGKENVERIKQQNAMKNGESYSSGPSTSNSTKSTSTETSSSLSSQNTSADASMTIEKNNDSGLVNSFKYIYIQRKVNLHENTASNSTIVFQNCEVYRKGVDYFVKIGEQYYKIQHCNKQYYNRTITYDSRPYYFNM